MTRDDLQYLADKAMVAVLRWLVTERGGAVHGLQNGEPTIVLTNSHVVQLEEMAEAWYDGPDEPGAPDLRQRDLLRDRLDDAWAIMRDQAALALMQEAHRRNPKLPEE
jgi:hypothetical protein